MALPVRDLDARRLASGEYQGYRYEVLHNGLGFRCGYVCIPRGHVWFDLAYDDIPAEVHGGLTFGTREATEPITALGISLPARPRHSTANGNEYWVGFDCAHAWDAPDPALHFIEQADDHMIAAFSFMHNGGTIRTTDYVVQQCMALIDQAILARLSLNVLTP